MSKILHPEVYIKILQKLKIYDTIKKKLSSLSLCLSEKTKQTVKKNITYQRQTIETIDGRGVRLLQAERAHVQIL